MTYLYNSWYAAAFSEDVSQQPFARTILEIPIVFYRRQDGAAAALHDRCPHRFVPLSRGKVRGDLLVCGYHGLCVDSKGNCVDERLNARAREQASLRSFPLVERYGVLWIWMGEAALAEPSRIPDFSFLDAPGRHVYRGTTYTKANYVLDIDNLMDLSHLDYVHINSIGNGELKSGKHTVKQEGESTVHSNWWVPNIACPHQFEKHVHAQGRPVDEWLEMRWDAPGMIKLDVGVTLAGRPRSEGTAAVQAHLLTPETASTTYYLWIVTLPNEGEPPEFVAAVREFTRGAFEDEDLPILEAQQRAMKSNDFWAEKPVLFAEDAGAVRARRVLEGLVKKEQASRSVQTSGALEGVA